MKRFWPLLLAALLAAGCSQAKPATTGHISTSPTVKAVRPEMRTIHSRVSQPGVIEPYEQTALFSKVAGYVQKWNVDIGAQVKKAQVLAEILVPELKEELAQKQALILQDEAMEDQAERLVKVADRNSEAAHESVSEAQANLKRYQADVERWQGELNRLTGMVRDQVVNPEVLEETRKQFKSSQSAEEAAVAGIRNKESEALAADAQIEKARADLKAAQAKVKVSEADERRVAALVAYTKITAPYDGVIIVRNVNTGDFVRPASGDSSGRESSEGGGKSSPLFVVARTDPMMFVIGVPEVDAPYVSVGTKASIRLQSLAGREFNVPVTRTSLALANESRTLQAEIDLPNPKGELLPGMYAYGALEIERPKVWAIPTSATVQIGNRICCYLVNEGKAVRTQLQSGVSDGNWTEVAKRRTYSNTGEPGAWEDFTGSEDVISGDLSEVADGKDVRVEAAK